MDGQTNGNPISPFRNYDVTGDKKKTPDYQEKSTVFYGRTL